RRSGGCPWSIPSLNAARVARRSPASTALDLTGRGLYPRRAMPPVRSSLHAQVPEAWRALLPDESPATFASLEALLEAEAHAGHSVCPPRPRLFAALQEVAPADVRVVLLGQDPYPS